MLYLYMAKDSTIFHLSTIRTGNLFFYFFIYNLDILKFFLCVNNLLCYLFLNS